MTLEAGADADSGCGYDRAPTHTHRGTHTHTSGHPHSRLRSGRAREPEPATRTLPQPSQSSSAQLSSASARICGPLRTGRVRATVRHGAFVVVTGVRTRPCYRTPFYGGGRINPPPLRGRPDAVAHYSSWHCFLFC